MSTKLSDHVNKQPKVGTETVGSEKSDKVKGPLKGSNVA